MNFSILLSVWKITIDRVDPKDYSVIIRYQQKEYNLSKSAEEMD